VIPATASPPIGRALTSHPNANPEIANSRGSSVRLPRSALVSAVAMASAAAPWGRVSAVCCLSAAHTTDRPTASAAACRWRAALLSAPLSTSSPARSHVQATKHPEMSGPTSTHEKTRGQKQRVARWKDARNSIRKGRDQATGAVAGDWARDRPREGPVGQDAGLEPIDRRVHPARASMQVHVHIGNREKGRGEPGDDEESPRSTLVAGPRKVERCDQPAGSAWNKGGDEEHASQRERNLARSIDRSRPGSKPRGAGVGRGRRGHPFDVWLNITGGAAMARELGGASNLG
jgi:hypothetical protein